MRSRKETLKDYDEEEKEDMDYFKLRGKLAMDCHPQATFDPRGNRGSLAAFAYANKDSIYEPFEKDFSLHR